MAVKTAHVAQLVGKNPFHAHGNPQAERADWHVIVQKLVAPGCKLNGWTLAAKDSIDSDHPQDGPKERSQLSKMMSNPASWVDLLPKVKID